MADLAQSWTVDPKGARWTFRLRSDARWQDGVPVTSEDVVYTVHVLQDPAYTGPLAAGWQGVTATAIDATTVQFDLAVPLGGFLQAATQPLLPAHLLAGVSVADLADAPFSTRPVGDGPFALTDLTAQAAELVPVLGPLNAGSGPLATLGAGTVASGRAAPGGAGAAVLPGPDEAIAAYRAGEVDAVSGLSPAAAAALAAHARDAPHRLSRHDAHRHLPEPPARGRAVQRRAGSDGAPRGGRPGPPDHGPAGRFGPGGRDADSPVLVGLRREGGACRGLRPEGRSGRPAGRGLDEGHSRLDSRRRRRSRSPSTFWWPTRPSTP